MLRLRMSLISCDLNADTIMHLHRKSAVTKEPSDAVCQLKYTTLMTRELCPGLWNRELLNKHFVFEQEAPSNWRSGVNASSRLYGGRALWADCPPAWLKRIGGVL